MDSTNSILEFANHHGRILSLNDISRSQEGSKRSLPTDKEVLSDEQASVNYILMHERAPRRDACCKDDYT